MRTQRNNGTTTYKYTYIGSQLTQITVGSNKLLFAYDANGTPLAVTYNGTAYYYVTNLKGNVVAILDSTGTAVVTYTYDAWGKPLTTVDNTSVGLGDLNPLRYRGYVYDWETGLYYLQSRYYNPEWGRFLNADAYASTGQGVLGYNMFAYCNNNPILLSDYSGNSATLAGAIVGAVCGFFGALISELNDQNEGIRWDKVMKCTASTALAGAAAGFVADVSIATFGAGTAIFIAAGAGALFSGLNSAYTQSTLKGSFDPKKSDK